MEAGHTDSKCQDDWVEYQAVSEVTHSPARHQGAYFAVGVSCLHFGPDLLRTAGLSLQDTFSELG